jgi:hypothetical protein
LSGLPLGRWDEARVDARLQDIAHDFRDRACRPDHSRLAYSEILPDEKRASCLRFPSMPCASFKSRGNQQTHPTDDHALRLHS